MAAKTDTRDKILDLAETLMKEKGYSDFSYANLSSELGIKNAAVHYYFPAKEDLGKAIMERALKNFFFWKEQSSISDLTPKDRIVAFADLYYMQNLEGSSKLCLMGSSAAAFPVFTAELQGEVQKMADAILDWLAQTFEEGREKWEFNFNGSAKAMAGVYISTLIGGLQLSRIEGREFFQTTVHQLWNQLLAKR